MGRSNFYFVLALFESVMVNVVIVKFSYAMIVYLCSYVLIFMVFLASNLLFWKNISLDCFMIFFDIKLFKRSHVKGDKQIFLVVTDVMLFMI